MIHRHSYPKITDDVAEDLLSKHAPRWEEKLLDSQKLFEVYDAIMSCMSTLPETHPRKLSQEDRVRRRKESRRRATQRVLARKKVDVLFASKIREANRLTKQRSRDKAFSATAGQ